PVRLAGLVVAARLASGRGRFFGGGSLGRACAAGREANAVGGHRGGTVTESPFSARARKSRRRAGHPPAAPWAVGALRPPPSHSATCLCGSAPWVVGVLRSPSIPHAATPRFMRRSARAQSSSEATLRSRATNFVGTR